MSGNHDPAAAAAADPEEFRGLVEPHLPGLYRTALLVVLDADLARDAVQEALVRAYRFVDRIRPGEPVGPWLQRLTLNEARRLSGRRRREPLPLPELIAAEADRAADPEWAAVAGEDRQRLWQALGRLSPAHRTVLVLRYYHDLPEPEIARVLGLRLGTVKSRLHHARRMLRDWIGEEAPDLVPPDLVPAGLVPTSGRSGSP